MSSSQEIALAEEAERRAQGSGDAAALGQARLDLAIALDAGDRQADGFEVARRGIKGLSSSFLAAPSRYAFVMRGLVAQYMALAGRSGESADQGMLAPISQALGDVMRAEDANDD